MMRPGDPAAGPATAGWVLTLAGTYIVPGFRRTYYGGWAGRITPLAARAALKDLKTPHTFVTQLENGSRREWWKLVPQDSLIASEVNPADGSKGHSYCLSDSGRSYVVYTENTRATDLSFNGPHDLTYRVTRFDPRMAQRTLLTSSVNGGTAVRLLSPERKDWVFEGKRGRL